MVYRRAEIHASKKEGGKEKEEEGEGEEGGLENGMQNLNVADEANGKEGEVNGKEGEANGEQGKGEKEEEAFGEAGQCIWLARVRPEDCENIVRFTVLQGKVVKPARQLRGGFDRVRGLVSW